MDFGDIFALLLYIIIPIYISGKRKADKAKKAQQTSHQRNRQPMHRPPAQRQPAQDKAQGGVMGWLESMAKELERAAGEGRPAGGPKTVTKPAEPAAQAKTYKAPVDVPTASGTPGQSREAKTGGIPVWRVAPVVRGTPAADGKRALKEPVRTRPPAREAVPAAAGQGDYALFGKDELVKGIILSEILQPPVTLRQRNKRRPF
jgi:hypothetical protein